MAGNETANYTEQPFPGGAISGGVVSGDLFLEGSFLEKAIFEAHSLLQRPEKGDLLLLSLELRVICACYQLRLSAPQRLR